MYTRFFKTTLFYLTIMLLFSCKKQHLVISKQVYSGSQMQINGYYYSVDPLTNEFDHLYFFYKNGVVRNSPVSCTSIAELDNKVTDLINFQDDYPEHWGLFTIDGYNITIETFSEVQSTDFGFGNSGSILNDSTFELNLHYSIKHNKRKNDKVITPQNSYHFRAFTPKPDSTNKFTN